MKQKTISRISGALCGLMLSASLLPLGASAAVAHDLNDDGVLDPADARLALRAAIGLVHYEKGSAKFKAADANNDGELGPEDARLVLRAAIGLDISAETKPTKAQQTDSVSAYEKEVIRLVNVERANKGLPALKQNDKLCELARKKAEDMYKKGYFDHTSPTYGSAEAMINAAGIKWHAVGENIAYGQRNPQEVVNSWMNSTGHRANILNKDYTEIGVGYSAQGNYWTQMFIG